MTYIRQFLFFFLFIASLTASAGAQVRFDVISSPYAGSGISVSVGNSGYCQQPVYNTGYVVYPVGQVRRRHHRRNRGVVVAPVYNTGYYSNGNCNTNGYYVNNGYYNQGYYNQGYYNPGYGFPNNGRCR